MSIVIQWLNQYAREKKLLGTMSKKIQELEKEIEIQKQRVILAGSQNYCQICGNTLDGYIPPREQEN